MINKWKQFNESRNENQLIELWNAYLSVIDGIDGIISEHGELPDSYFLPNVESDLDNITSGVEPKYPDALDDIARLESDIIQNSKDILDGLDGAIGSGRYSEDRYFQTGSIEKLRELIK